MTQHLDSLEFDSVLKNAVANDCFQLRIHAPENTAVNSTVPLPRPSSTLPRPVNPITIAPRLDVSNRSAQRVNDLPNPNAISQSEFHGLVLLRVGITFTLLLSTLAALSNTHPNDSTGSWPTVFALALLTVNALASTCLFARPYLTLIGCLPYFLLVEYLSRTLSEHFQIDPYTTRVALLLHSVAMGLFTTRVGLNSKGTLQGNFHRSLIDWFFLCTTIAVGFWYFRSLNPIQFDWKSMLHLLLLATMSSLCIPPWIRDNLEGARWVRQGTFIIAAAMGLMTLTKNQSILLASTSGTSIVLILLIAIAIGWGVRTIESTQRSPSL